MCEEWIEKLQMLVSGEHSGTGDELDAGAELIVYDPDGTEVFRAPLARHVRRDTEEPQIVWLRPVVAGDRSREHGRYVYSLSLNRRRALTVVEAKTDETGLNLTLRSGQTARVEHASAEAMVELSRWDAFFLLELTADEQAELNALDADGWYGRYA